MACLIIKLWFGQVKTSGFNFYSLFEVLNEVPMDSNFKTVIDSGRNLIFLYLTHFFISLLLLLLIVLCILRF